MVEEQTQDDISAEDKYLVIGMKYMISEIRNYASDPKKYLNLANVMSQKPELGYSNFLIEMEEQMQVSNMKGYFLPALKANKSASLTLAGMSVNNKASSAASDGTNDPELLKELSAAKYENLYWTP